MKYIIFLFPVKTMKLKTCLAMTFLSSILLPLSAYSASVPPVEGLHTSGAATLSVPAEMVVIRVSVSAKQKDALTAKQSVDQRVADYFDFLEKNGIEKKDIDTTNINTGADYVYTEKSGPRVSGYHASRDLKITLHQPEKLNDFLDGALKRQLNDINDIDFTVAHPEVYEEKVRQMAIQNAIDKAQSLAKGFGAKVGPAVSIKYITPVEEERWHYISYQAKSAKAQIASTYSAKDATFMDRVEVVFSLVQ